MRFAEIKLADQMARSKKIDLAWKTVETAIGALSAIGGLAIAAAVAAGIVGLPLAALLGLIALVIGLVLLLSSFIRSLVLGGDSALEAAIKMFYPTESGS